MSRPAFGSATPSRPAFGAAPPRPIVSARGVSRPSTSARGVSRPSHSRTPVLGCPEADPLTFDTPVPDASLSSTLASALRDGGTPASGAPTVATLTCRAPVSPRTSDATALGPPAWGAPPLNTPASGVSLLVNLASIFAPLDPVAGEPCTSDSLACFREASVRDPCCPGRDGEALSPVGGLISPSQVAPMSDLRFAVAGTTSGPALCVPATACAPPPLVRVIGQPNPSGSG